MSEQDFEELTDVRLTAALRAFGNEAVRAFEPGQVAQAAIAAGAGRPWSWRRRPLQGLGGHRNVGWAAALLLAGLALIAGALVAGSTVLHRPPIAPPALGAGCDVLDPLASRSGAVDGGGWPSAPRLGRTSMARPGLLVGWANYALADSASLDLDLTVLDPTTGAETRLTHFDKSFSSQSGEVVWSPDGSAIATRFDDHHQCTNLYVVTADGSRLVRPIRDTQEESNDWFAWAPDGSALVTVHGRAAPPAADTPATAQVAGRVWTRSLRIVPRNGSPAFDLGTPCAGCDVVNTPMWSPDGRLIASTFGRPAPGSGTPFSTSGVAVAAPDRIGWTILYEERTPDNGYLSPIGWLDTRRILATRPSPDGKKTELVTLSADAPGAPTSTGVLLPFDPIAVSPDGRSVVGVAGAWSADGTPQYEEVDVVEVGTGTRHTVWTSGTGVEVGGATWSPDDRNLALSAVSYPGGDTSKAGVWIVNVDGTGLRRVRAAPMDVAWQAVWP